MYNNQNNEEDVENSSRYSNYSKSICVQLLEKRDHTISILKGEMLNITTLFESIEIENERLSKENKVLKLENENNKQMCELAKEIISDTLENFQTSSAQLPSNEIEYKKKYEELYERLNKEEERASRYEKIYQKNKKIILDWKKAIEAQQQQVSECNFDREKIMKQLKNTIEELANTDYKLERIENVLYAVRKTRNIYIETRNELIIEALFQYTTPRGISNKSPFLKYSFQEFSKPYLDKIAELREEKKKSESKYTIENKSLKSTSKPKLKFLSF